MISAASLGSHMWDLLKIAVSSYAYPARMAMHRRRTHKRAALIRLPPTRLEGDVNLKRQSSANKKLQLLLLHRRATGAVAEI